jgi:hypothetical protein
MMLVSRFPAQRLPVMIMPPLAAAAASTKGGDRNAAVATGNAGSVDSAIYDSKQGRG